MKHFLKRPVLLAIALSSISFIPVKAQYTDSVGISSRPVFITKSLYAPLSLMAAGITTTIREEASVNHEFAEERNEHFRDFNTHIDNYLQYAPIAIVYGLDALGIRAKTDIANRTAILIKGELLMTGTVTLLKNTTHELRPDGSAYNSFPSGHTAQAFAAATFLSEEYKERYPWMPYAAYGMASGVGLLRMANNKHYLGDVLVGAGLGILSMKIAYWTHRYAWSKRQKERHIFNPKAS